MLAVAQPSPAGADWIEFVQAYEQGDYVIARRELQPFVEQGIARAQFNHGVMYYNGLGVPQDYAEAVKWYLKAAEQEVLEAREPSSGGSISE